MSNDSFLIARCVTKLLVQIQNHKWKEFILSDILMSAWHYYKVRMKYYVWKYRGLVTQESNHSISILFNLHCNCILHLTDFLIMDQYSFSHNILFTTGILPTRQLYCLRYIFVCSPIMFTRQQLFRVSGCLLWWQAFDKELRIRNVLLNVDTRVSEYETAGTSPVPERLPNKYMWGKTMKRVVIRVG